jgi:Tfp pilus assembly protein PilF
MRRMIGLALVAAMLAVPVAAQKAPKEPKRPRLASGQDTNSALAYYQFGVSSLPKYPDAAADAFYWATRLAPQWADPYYARRIALLLRERARVVDYLLGKPYIVNSADFRRIDSLEYQALIRNPFVLHNLDRVLYDEVMYRLSGGEVRIFYGRRTGDPWYDGRLALAGGQYALAVQRLHEAIKRYPKEPIVHADRARAFYALAQFDSAAAELTTLLGRIREEDEQKLVYFFDSKAMFEYSLGMVHVQRDDFAAAREAFGRALTEDLSFYMAHAALGDVALRQGDTTTALHEYDMAVQLKGDDAGLHYGYAMALLRARRAVDASKHFQEAIKYEPYFAMPYYYLGRLNDASEITDEALKYYDQFLARGAKALAEYEWVTKRVAELRAAPAGKTP